MLLDDSTSLPGAELSLLAAADLQDSLMVVSNDLDRLQRLLADAAQTLMDHFCGASGQLAPLLSAGAEHPAAPGGELHGVMAHLGGAVVALQFQDMASQLIANSHQRLRSCADRLAREVMGDDEDGTTVVEAPPTRPNPVTQDEMDAGSIQLF